MKKTVILGTEYDEDRFNQLLSVIQRMGANQKDIMTGMAGSQELLSISVQLDQEIIHIERETYIGLSIHGPDNVIDEICQQMDLLDNKIITPESTGEQ